MIKQISLTALIPIAAHRQTQPKAPPTQALRRWWHDSHIQACIPLTPLMFYRLVTGDKLSPREYEQLKQIMQAKVTELMEFTDRRLSLALGSSVKINKYLEAVRIPEHDQTQARDHDHKIVFYNPRCAKRDPMAVLKLAVQDDGSYQPVEFRTRNSNSPDQMLRFWPQTQNLMLDDGASQVMV